MSYQTIRRARCIRVLALKMTSEPKNADPHLPGCLWLSLTCKQEVDPTVLEGAHVKQLMTRRYINTHPREKGEEYLTSLQECKIHVGRKPQNYTPTCWLIDKIQNWINNNVADERFSLMFSVGIWIHKCSLAACIHTFRIVWSSLNSEFPFRLIATQGYRTQSVLLIFL